MNGSADDVAQTDAASQTARAGQAPDLRTLAPAEPGPRARGLPWPSRVLDAGVTYLPLVLMALLALGTWWLVKNTPLFDSGRPVAALRHEPDYTMTQFTVQRFGLDGAMRAQLEGDILRHYPDTDTTEIDNPRIRAAGADGSVTLATARRALANADGSEVQLFGDAHVVREATSANQAIDFRSPFLHVFLKTEQLRSDQPVVVIQGGTEVQAGSMNYDHLAGTIDFGGRARAVFAAPARVATPRGAAKGAAR